MQVIYHPPSDFSYTTLHDQQCESSSSINWAIHQH